MKLKAGLSLLFTLATLLTLPAFGLSIAAPEEIADTEKANPLLRFTSIGTATAKGENVNIRGQATFNGEVITRLKKGESVTLLETITLKKAKKDEPTNWFRIALPTNTPVWVLAEFVDATNHVVLPKRLNVRAGPGENFSIVARMEKGDAITSLRQVNEWLEIAPPASAFGFVAADLLEKPVLNPASPAPIETTENKVVPVPAPAPVPAPEAVVVPPAETITPATPETNAAPVVAAATNAPVIATLTPAPAPIADPPVPAPEPAVEEPPVKRVVIREGYIKESINIQALTYYQLHTADGGMLIDYLRSVEVPKTDGKITWQVPKFYFDKFVGKKVIIMGTEGVNKRWKGIPVLEVENIELAD